MKKDVMKVYFPISTSFVLLIAGMLMTSWDMPWFEGTVVIVWFALAYLPVGFPIMKEAMEEMSEGNVFSEFTLMVIATIGAFIVGEYPEGVGVMLFYSIGEMFQDHAVDKAKRDIKALVDIRPDRASVIVDGRQICMKPEEVAVGHIIEVKPGERVPLDGQLLSSDSSFNTAALTGESMPRIIPVGGEVLAGMISSDKVVRLRVTRLYAQSALSRIMEMVNNASERKAPAELFVRKFARIYTPVVIILAVLTSIVPYFYSFVDNNFQYVFSDWFYRALIFLVISCPCALVVSIPLSYFAGIGFASRRGILFKGGNYLDAILNVKSVVFDKTGTLTQGVFSVTEVVTVGHTSEVDTNELLSLVSAVERYSNHPISKAIIHYASQHVTSNTDVDVMSVTDLPGYGLSADISGEKVLVGTLRLLDKYDVSYPERLKDVPETIVACSKNAHFMGALLLSDTLKEDALEAVASLRRLKIPCIEILSGDKQRLVDQVASVLNVDSAYGDLLPEGKVAHIEQLKTQKDKSSKAYSDGGVAFVGDGINDAPVLALSDVGIAMGGSGSDVAIETADVVIQDERPSKVAMAIEIARRTRHNVIENVTMAISVKIAVLVLGVLGIANLWEAVFADVGVTVLAVFNSMRLIKR